MNQVGAIAATNISISVPYYARAYYIFIWNLHMWVVHAHAHTHIFSVLFLDSYSWCTYTYPHTSITHRELCVFVAIFENMSQTFAFPIVFFHCSSISKLLIIIVIIVRTKLRAFKKNQIRCSGASAIRERVQSVHILL